MSEQSVSDSYPSSRWQLAAAAHRVFFFGGALQLVAVIVFWVYLLAGWYLALWTPPVLTIVAPLAHIFLMLYGLFTFFVFGFLFTVFPRWLQCREVPRGRYVGIAAALTLGMACFYAGIFLSRALAIAGVLVFVAAWLTALATLLRIWLASDKPDKRFALFPFACVSFGCAGALACALWLITQQPVLYAITEQMGLWLYLVPLIVAVSHRMIPFFSSRVLDGYTVMKPGWTLPATLACVLAHFALAVSGHAQWTVLPDLPLAALAVWHSLRWALWRSLRVPLLGMLHVSFAWLGVAMLLYAAQSLLRLCGATFDLGLAPLHALGIGYITGMVVAMASRVSLGHSGRPLVADRVTLWTFAMVQGVAVLRVLAEVPPFVHQRGGLWLILAAGALWLLALVPWSLRFGRIYLVPRVDGAPG